MTPIDTARVEKVIITTLLRRGKGTEDDPMRVIKQIWTLDGELIAEVDEWKMWSKNDSGRGDSRDQ